MDNRLKIEGRCGKTQIQVFHHSYYYEGYNTFQTEKLYVGMVTEGYAAGATVAGKVNPIAPGREPNVNVCVDVDEVAFEEWFAGEFCR